MAGTPRRSLHAALALALLAVPLWLPSPYHLHVLIMAGIFAILALSLNLLLGYAGLHVAVLLAGSPGGNGVLEGARRVPTQPGEALTLRGKETEAQRGEIVVTVDTKPSVPVRASARFDQRPTSFSGE